jgi:hypothetical protein
LDFGASVLKNINHRLNDVYFKAMSVKRLVYGVQFCICDNKNELKSLSKKEFIVKNRTRLQVLPPEIIIRQ